MTIEREAAVRAGRILEQVGAPLWLRRHGALVAEAAQLLVDGVGVEGLDARWVLLGAWLHDVGKVEHPGELSGPGKAHEVAGRRLLLELGVEEKVADVCVSHGRWQGVEGLEPLLVVLADKLWKGKRVSALEEKVIDGVALRLGVSRWAVWERLMALFDGVAADGDGRLGRSLV